MTDPYCSSCHETMTDRYPINMSDGNRRYVCKYCYDDYLG